MKNLELIPIYATYLVLFGFAAQSKLESHGVPEWFLKQFSATPLDLFPGALYLQFYFIASLETLVALGFLVSLARKEFLPGRARPVLHASLLLACMIFVILSVGLRMTGDFNTAAQVFMYFAVSWYFLRNLNDPRTNSS